MNELQSMKICEREITVKEYDGKRVVTFKDIDRVHHRPDGTARKRFNDNKKHFIEGEDFYAIPEPSEIRTLGFTRAQGGLPDKIILITESGYLMLVKSFTDDLAWDVQRQLVNCYFRQKEVVKAYISTRPLTTDDYMDAAKAIAKCHNSRLPIVLDLYRKAGLDVSRIETQKATPDEADIMELAELLNQYTLTELCKILNICKSSIYYYKTGKHSPRKERREEIIRILKRSELH